MQTDIQKEVLTRLDALAAKLGVVTSHLWAVLVRQQQVQFLVDLLYTVVTVAGVVVAAVLLRNFLRKFKATNDEMWAGGAFAAGVVLLIVGICACVNIASLMDSVGRLMNPEYYALRSLMRLMQ